MKQATHPITLLRAELERAKRMRLSPHRIDCNAELPVNLATIYRWLKGEVQPGVDRVFATIEAIRRFLDREEERIGRRANTHGGPVVLDEEFRHIERGGRVVPLKGQEFQIFNALHRTKRALRRDWICEAYDVPPKSFDRAMSNLKQKIEAIDLEIVFRPGLAGEPPGYVLSDRRGDAKETAA